MSSDHEVRAMSNLFNALGNHTRMTILEMIFESKKPLHIKAVSRNLKADYGSVYRHVKVLERNKLLEIYEVGRSRVLSPIDSGAVKALIEAAKAFL